MNLNNFFSGFTFWFNKSLRSKLIIWFLLISLVPLIWVTFIAYELSKKIILHQATENLRAVNLSQTQAIENFFKDKLRSTLAMAKTPAAINNMKEFSTFEEHPNREEYKKLHAEKAKFVAAQDEILGFNNEFLITPTGTVVFSVLPSDLLGENLLSDMYKNNELNRILKNTITMLETQATTFTYFHPLEPPAIFISTPIFNEGVLIGILVIQLNNRDVYDSIVDYSGLGETGETILIGQIGDKLYIQSPLRHYSSKNFMHYVPWKTPFGHYVEEIFKGNRLVSRVFDFQGEDTLMAGRFISPVLHWGVITKINLDELLSPIENLKYIFFLITLTTASIVIFIATNIANSISNPILMLTKKTKLMAAGDLTQHIDIQSNDEISRLADSFNVMTEQLHNMIQHLDAIVAKRTGEVKLQNVKLENTINELKETQDRLINQEKLASLGALTAGIAHEIKNPLNFINNFAELSLQIDKDIQVVLDKIRNKTSVEELHEMQEFLDVLKINIIKISEHGKRADSIIRNMLLHARTTSSDIQAVDLNNVLEEYVSLSYHGIRANDPTINIRIIKDFDKNLPKININLQEINRVFLNILNNAFYSVNKKKKEFPDYEPIVKVTSSHTEDHIIISFWDNGEGMTPEVLQKLFTPFFTTKPAGEGTGLGLSLSYNIIVQGHHGTLTANSVLGDYAEIILTLPVKRGG